ncbi:MAG: SIR2 family protein [Snowella sp.]|jgi:hypothetical protein|nr:MAG: SIR2 family protein [Snowella sp.]
MSNYEDYKTHITQDIKDCLEGMVCQPILFIGSGFSIRYAKTPSWEGLLREMANLCSNIDKEFAYYKQIHNKDYIQISTLFANSYRDWAWGTGRENFPEEFFSQEFPSDVYIKHQISEYLKNLISHDWFGKLDELKKQEIEAIKAITPYVIITTNYDTLIESVFSNNYETIVGEKILKNNTFGTGEIFKIHGSVTDPSSLVLTVNDYEIFRKKRKYLSAKLLTYFAEHPLLFIGYSANDPNIQDILSDIDELISPDGSLIPNIYMLEWNEEISKNVYPQREKIISIDNSKSVRIKNIIASDFTWVFEAFTNQEPQSINPKTLRFLLSRTYNLVRYDIPKKTVQVDFELLENRVNSETEFVKLFGITTIDDPSKINVSHPYLISMLPEQLGFVHYYHVNLLFDKIAEDKGVKIKDNDNKYHVSLKTGKKSITHKYSQACIDLLLKVKNDLDYEIEL